MQTTRRRYAFMLPITAGVLLIGVSFIAGRATTSGNDVTARTTNEEPTPAAGNQTPSAFVAPQQTRTAAPKFEQVINGIHAGPMTQRRGGPCAGLNSGPGLREAPYAENTRAAEAANLPISPKYLPPGTTSDPSRDVVVFCQDSLAAAGRDFYVPSDRSSGRYGGFLLIRRWIGEPYALVDLPAEDFSAATILGRPGLTVKPLTSDGYGDSAVVVRDSAGVTVLYGRGLTLQELLRVAESLY